MRLEVGEHAEEFGRKEYSTHKLRHEAPWATFANLLHPERNWRGFLIGIPTLPQPKYVVGLRNKSAGKWRTPRLKPVALMRRNFRLIIVEELQQHAPRNVHQ